ncbi:MAG TPA: hypothetical protein VE111_00265 [Bradyrhizobium sp.]|nr:hypothetical protein [Bradyrhizobium sp.]
MKPRHRRSADGPRFIKCRAIFNPNVYVVPEFVEPHALPHKLNLLDADSKEERRETNKRFFAQIAPAVKIIAPREVAFSQKLFVLIFGQRQSARDRPKTMGAESLAQHGIAH